MSTLQHNKRFSRFSYDLPNCILHEQTFFFSTLKIIGCYNLSKLTCITYVTFLFYILNFPIIIHRKDVE